MKYAAVAIGLWMLVGVGLQTGVFKAVTDRLTQAASVFFVDSSTPDSLHKAYQDAQRGKGAFKVLIVPGHDNVASGAYFGGLREADLTLAAAKKLAADFADDKNIEVRLARNDAGYDPEIAQYFVDHRADILAYRASQTALMQGYKASGDIASDVIVNHNFAPSEVAIRLYGINKWANEQGYNLIIHIHFNDVPRANRALPGWPTGFALYVPEHQFSNAKGSMAVAQDIKARLEDMYHVSTLPAESHSPTEDQELIAIGSNNSLDASSVLIEYSYIYEPLVQLSALRDATLSQMAEQTYLGVEDFVTAKQVAVQ
ncbi:MAG TPA: N-acetylmuramoyl-L-alanine amidase [Candidatus Paceibacterota bacterium]|jgi:N-acetylmuramoyl-L-alanine amidase|nr:N-acetylmuramoyl-L-alanine amidase [Candidatus Paceibacterota bacterium]